MMTKQITSIPASLGQEMEYQEAACFSEHFRDLPPAVASRLGTGLCQFGGGTAVMASKIDILAFNRVIGLGLSATITEAVLEEIITYYRSAGISRFFIPLSKTAERPEVLRLLAAKGFRHHNNWARMLRPVHPIPEGKTDLRIEIIGPEQRDVFAGILLRSFDWPEALRPLLANPVGRPGWRHYLACDGNKPVAAAALFIRGETASMAFAATLPGYRGRGAQSALIALRLRHAAAAGCRWATTETAEDKPERPVASCRNMRRMGFETACLRPNYLWTTP